NDTLGNLNYTSVSFTIDTINPDINITFPLQNNTNTSNINSDVNFTFFDANINHIWYSNDTYTINRSLGSGGTYTNLSNITWSEGLHNVTIWTNDSAGNLNFSTRSFRVDTTNPDLNITFPEVNNTNTTDNLIDVNFTFSDSFTLVDSCWYSNDTYTVNLSLGSGGTCANITNITWSTAVHNVTIYVNDTLGNLNYTSRTINVSPVVADTIFPDISIISPSNLTNTSNTNLNVNFTVSDNIALGECWYSNDTYLVNKSTGGCGINITNITWSQGGHNVTVYVNDSSNNVNKSTVTFMIDSVLPAIAILFPTTNNTNTTDTSYDINFTFSDLNQISAVWYSNDTNLINRSLGSGGTFFNITNLTWSQGNHNITIYVNDTFGNVNQTRISFTVDTTNPDLTILVPSVNNTNTTNTNQNVNFTFSDSFTQVAFAWYNNDTNSGANKSLGSGGTFFNISNITWSEGKHNVTIYANDTVGNENKTSISFTIDTVNPDITISFPSNNTNSSNINLDVNFTVSDINLDSCWYSNDTYSINRSLGSGGTCVNVTNITWSEAKHNVTIYVNDSAGNLNYTGVSFTIDSINPDVTISFPSNNSNFSTIDVDVNFTFFDLNINHIWYTNDTNLINRSLGSGGTFFNITNLTWSQGNHNITIYVNDTFGNVNQSRISFTVDSINPTIEYISPTDTNNTSFG
ncbi:MAG: Ig-like domain-containing protein, partial [Nanoarchaeota archaeon]